MHNEIKRALLISSGRSHLGCNTYMGGSVSQSYLVAIFDTLLSSLTPGLISMSWVVGYRIRPGEGGRCSSSMIPAVSH